ncbi:MAG: sodium/proton antiporter NhaB [Alphaproteobacteria bacterium]|nr:MAG: sodium/proton antiporter NhaB [Alphaproteobacteria bacterium]
MARTVAQGFVRNFLGNAPGWYKLAIVGFLLLNPIVMHTLGPVVAGWLLVIEFIFTLAMALKCYPLQPGGLLALEAVFLGLTTAGAVKSEVEHAFEVLLLLIFMVAGIYFMKDLLLYVFTKLLVRVRNKILLSLLFSFIAAVLSAFLDALTVTAVVISIGVGFYSIYHKVASGKHFDHDHDHQDDQLVHDQNREDLENFRLFLRGLLMHAAVGTALGGVCTLVGEPQNIIIAQSAGWGFIEFFFRMAPVSMPVLAVGLMTVVVVEYAGWFGYGGKLPANVRKILEDYDKVEDEKRTPREVASLAAQAGVGIWLVVALIFHLGSVGLIGLSVIVLATVLTGIIEEHRIGHAFEEALPFTALLVVFFAIVAVINDQQLFGPIINRVLELEGQTQIAAFYMANGVLSMISDNVFVATIYIREVADALADGRITRDQFDMLAIAINTGTNIPSVATPNGQAAFLFLLTSALAPLIRLSYMRMVIMALPYTITMSITGLLMTYYLLQPMTDRMYEMGLIHHAEAGPVAQPSEGHH